MHKLTWKSNFRWFMVLKFKFYHCLNQDLIFNTSSQFFHSIRIANEIAVRNCQSSLFRACVPAGFFEKAMKTQCNENFIETRRCLIMHLKISTFHTQEKQAI